MYCQESKMPVTSAYQKNREKAISLKYLYININPLIQCYLREMKYFEGKS